MALIAAVLTTACSLGLPGSDSNEDLTAGKRLPLPEAAPRVDPQDLDVDFVEPRSKDEKKRKAKKASKKKRNGSAERKGTRKNGGGDGGGNATTPRSAPKERGRNPGGPGDPAKPKPRKNRPPKKKKSEPKDPPPVVVSDLTGDPQGEGQSPAYMDLERVELDASGEIFVAELTFASNLPAKMPNGGTAMLASVEVDRGDRKVSVYAEASDDGWRAHTNRSADFPGSLEISGRTMRFTLARSFFGARFDWYAHSSWTKSTTTNTEYFFDFAPDDQKGRYPSGGTT